eukprot:TRINITY_DN25125_c0_g1_i6.p1 TRINITY_DN25125_c0_g1~~TRINITY_DN25125_c0_g1_i6.p1  ORF type:complete len:156 (-),score=37.75 TRINITY_DN25125_c0_g1_i6:19-486(-)
MQIKPQLDKLGVPIIAVGNGNARFAKKFKEALKFDGNVYLDTDCKMFKVAALPRLSIWQAVKRFFNGTARAFYAKLSKNYSQSDLEGDGQQTGGVFVVGPGVGRPLRFSFRESDYDPDVFADNKEILKAVGWTEEKIGRAVQQECRDRSRMPSSA